MKTITQTILAILIATATLNATVKPGQIKIPNDAKEQIRLRAQTEWPGDYQMQAYTIENQTEAYRNLYAWAKNNSNNDLAESIFKKAQADWPGDFAMQWYEVQKEVEALREIYMRKKKS